MLLGRGPGRGRAAAGCWAGQSRVPQRRQMAAAGCHRRHPAAGAAAVAPAAPGPQARYRSGEAAAPCTPPLEESAVQAAGWLRGGPQQGLCLPQGAAVPRGPCKPWPAHSTAPAAGAPGALQGGHPVAAKDRESPRRLAHGHCQAGDVNSRAAPLRHLWTHPVFYVLYKLLLVHLAGCGVPGASGAAWQAVAGLRRGHVCVGLTPWWS